MDYNIIIYVLAFMSSVLLVSNIISIFCLYNQNTEYVEMRDDERV